MAIFQSLEFDGINSLDNGIFITGEAVYNAPEREVEMISIPGRNGDFALDKGRYENIQVTYPAGAFGTDQAEFAKKLRSFRNLLASKKGYKRLVDTYNPDEYRMAIFKDAFEVDAINSSKAGEFEIVFDCKPQRYLMSGEAKLSVNSGDMIYNPTPFDASPLLEVEGYGTIGFNGYEIEIANAMLGTITLASKTTFSNSDITIPLNSSLLEQGDEITIGEIKLRTDINLQSGSAVHESISDSDSNFTSVNEATGKFQYYSVVTTLPSFTITKGSTASYSDTVTSTVWGVNTYTTEISIDIAVSDSAITITRTLTHSGAHHLETWGTSTVDAVLGYSTASLLGDPTYIDCDLGEAYRIDNGIATSLNQHIDLGSDLPKLASGTNEITYDNTVTDLKITPRWWIV